MSKPELLILTVGKKKLYNFAANITFVARCCFHVYDQVVENSMFKIALPFTAFIKTIVAPMELDHKLIN